MSRNYPNQMSSAQTYSKQVNSINRFIEIIKEAINLEIGLCSQDQQYLNQGLHGIIEFEKNQKEQIDYHFS